jgi:NDP-sugar pyrophosphorylase family protein
VRNAILIVERESREEESFHDASSKNSLAPSLAQRGPLACVEVLGRSVVERLVGELHRAGVSAIAVFVNSANAKCVGSKVKVCATNEEVWDSATRQLQAYRQGSVEAVLVARVGAYLDFDLKDALQFHREHGQSVTRAFHQEKPMDLWIIDPAGIGPEADVAAILSAAGPSHYPLRGYVNRLERPQDLRRLVVDGLTSGCRLRPHGTELRPGIWMDDGAQVHRDARIVAPAFIGRGAKIAEQCLITRCSNVESDCQVDYGTVVEDSSILSNSYVGIGLDLSHSIVDGNSLLNLERGVMLEITDPCVIRQNKLLHPSRNFQSTGYLGFGSVQCV